MLKSVLITGASSGIGEAAAVHLAQAGFRVYAVARRMEKLREIQGLGGGRVHIREMDVTDPDSVRTCIASINAEAGPLFGLVNNAGASVMGPAESVSPEEWRRQFDVNLFGLMEVTRAVLPQMREAGAGRIVNIGSLAGRIALPFQGVYAASKHAVEGISDSMRREVKPFGVKVVVIRPGYIYTPFASESLSSLAQYNDDNPYTDQIRIFTAWRERQQPTAASPLVVVDAIEKALTAARPHSRYTAPDQMQGFLALRNILPAALIDRIFWRMTGLDAVSRKKGGPS
ncbi:MAG: SDR family oxidoreductase [Pseudomonadota bacterium]